MKVVVTGGTGNVGSRVMEQLAAEPAVTELVGVARRIPERPPGGARFVAADVASDDLTPHLAGAAAVVHLAWLFQPTHDPMVTWRANAVGTARLLDAAARAGVGAVVHASSIGAYSPAVDDRPVDETWPTHSMPAAAYGREKAYAERLLDTFEARHPGVRVVRFRPAFIFQRASASEQRRIFAGPFLPNRLVGSPMLPVLPLPAGLRFQALHTDDAAAAYRTAVLDETARGAYNLAAEPVVDAGVLGRVLGARPLPLPRLAVRGGLAAAWHLHLAPADPALLDLALSLPVLDAGRAHRELGWRAERSADDALREFVAGMRAGAGRATPPLAPDEAEVRLEEIATGVGERA